MEYNICKEIAMNVLSVTNIKAPAGVNGKEAWECCVKYGGVAAASRRMINPITGKCFTPSGISRPAYRYALSHLEEIRPQWEQIAFSEGVVPTEETWKAWLLQKARVAFYYKVAEYEKFVKDNELQGS